MSKNEVDGTPPGDSRVGTRLDSTVTNEPQKKYRKVIFSGALVEEYLYETPLLLGMPTTRTKKKKRVRTEEYQKRNGLQAQMKIKRLAAMNFKKGAKFITLTFDNSNNFDITSLPTCHSYYVKFLKRLKRSVGVFHYICVPERQKRGAIHYHMIVDLPYIQKEHLSHIWSHGFVDIRLIDDPVRRAAYLAKYLTKKRQYISA